MGAAMSCSMVIVTKHTVPWGLRKRSQSGRLSYLISCRTMSVVTMISPSPEGTRAQVALKNTVKACNRENLFFSPEKFICWKLLFTGCLNGSKCGASRFTIGFRLRCFVEAVLGEGLRVSPREVEERISRELRRELSRVDCDTEDESLLPASPGLGRPRCVGRTMWLVSLSFNVFW